MSAFCIVKIFTILEDKHVRKKREHICPEDTLRKILSVKKWTFFLGSKVSTGFHA